MRKPTLRQLLILMAVAEQKSVTRAARLLHLSQPAVTLSLKSLERAIGSPMFNRSVRGSFPTLAGEVLLARSQRLFLQFEQAVLSLYGGVAGAPTNHKFVARRLSNNHLRALIAVSEAGSIDHAAQKLNIAAPALGRTARELERLLKRSLYEKTPRGVGTNGSGTRLAGRFKVALREIDYALDEIAEIGGSERGKIIIGVVPQFASRLLSQAMAQFNEKHPTTIFLIHSAAYETLLAELQDGTIDILFGVLRAPNSAQDIEEFALFNDGYVVLARVGHPLAKEKCVTVKEMGAYSWILPPAGTPRRRVLDSLFKGRKKSASVAVETNSSVLRRDLLRVTDFLSIATSQEAATETRYGDVVTLQCPHLTDRGRHGYALRGGWKPTLMHIRFLEALRSCCPPDIAPGAA